MILQPLNVWSYLTAKTFLFGGEGGMEEKKNKTPKHFPNSAVSLSCTSHDCKISDQKSNHSKREYINSHDVKCNFIYLLFKSAKWIVSSIPGSTNTISQIYPVPFITHILQKYP